MVPVLNGVCIFAAINYNLQYQYPNPPDHAKPYRSISLLSSESVILISSHCFKKALPETDDGVIEYYLSLFSSVDGTRSNIKIAEYRPRLAKGTDYTYDVNTRARVGDYVSQSKLDSSSAFQFSVKRRDNNGKPSIGFGGNEMMYVIMSPFDAFM